MAKRSKLDWLKELRAADLSGSEFRVLVILATYSDARLLNAHPGSKRLMNDTGLARSTVIDTLKSLQMKGWIRMTEEGGNQYGHGRANTYSIHVPVIHKGPVGRTLKGPMGLTLVDREGSDLQAKGPIIGHQGSDLHPEKGLADRTPSGHTSGSESGPRPHHSAGEPSGPTPGPRTPDADPWAYDPDGYLSEDSYDHLVSILEPLDTSEATTVDAMLSRGSHPKAVINTISKRRAEGA